MRPEEARIGAEADPGPWRPETDLGALERGARRPRYPRPLPPSFSSLNPVFRSRARPFASPLSKPPAIRSDEGANPNESVPAIFPFPYAALAANSTLVHDVCRWVGRRGAHSEGMGERSSATEPDRSPRRGRTGRSGAGRQDPKGTGDRRFAGRR